MLTDAGLCHVYNGNSISQSFVNVGRNQYLQQSFEQNAGEFHPAKINGTGFQNQETFWFDVGIRYYLLGIWCTNILGYAIEITFNRSWESFAVSQQRRGPATLKGSAKIAINEWLSQFNVRGVQIEAPAGMETRIKISQTFRSAMGNIKALHPKDRKCQFLDEVKVIMQSTGPYFISNIISLKGR